MQGVKMTDQIVGRENASPGKCRTKSPGLKMQDLRMSDQGPSRKA